MAVAGGGDRRLQPARPGADHQHAAPSGRVGATGPADGDGASRPVRGFSMQPSQRLRPIRPTHSWLHDRHRRISSVAPGPGLGGEVGVGDLAAHDADEVAVALGERPLGLQRILEPADADDRQVDGLADAPTG